MNKIIRLVLAIAIAALCARAWAQVSVSAPWVRATVPGQRTAGAYMRITSRDGATLIGAESPAAGATEVHEMKMEGDVMRMHAVPRLELPAGKPVELQPGGYHVMLMELKQPLKKGDTVPIRLKIQSRDKSIRTLEVRAEVRDTPPAATGHDAGMKMH